MGCKGSKLDDQEAVALCRGRADLIAAAVRHRYALADAHAALADSLESLAAPLHLLLLQASPHLTLPSARKGGGGGRRALHHPPSSPPAAAGHSSHLPFGSSSGSESSSPPRRVPEQHPYPRYAYGDAPEPAFAYQQPASHVPDPAFPYPAAPEPAFLYPAPPEPAFAYPQPASSLQFYYARSRPPPASVAVAQRAPGSERVYHGSFDAAGGYPHYYPYGGEPAAAPAPPPRESSSWDFLNVFESYDSYDSYYYDSNTAAAAAAYTPSRSSREVREEEGIPELEDDEEESVSAEDVVTRDCSTSGGGCSRRSSVNGGVNSVAELNERQNAVAHQEVVGNVRRRPLAHRNVAAPPRRGVRNVDVAGEIKVQLVRAAEATRQISPLLEVGRPGYHPPSSVNHAPSRMMSAISVPHLGCKGIDAVDMGFGVERQAAESWSLSLTLEKLYFWERKLYGEVKAEEKMRLLLAKNSKRLKLLDQRGAEAHKIDATRNLLTKLSTKIRIAVRVIAKVSRKINKLRDEELGPQVHSLIQGFVKMWQDKLYSYKTQFQVISESSVVSGGNGHDFAMELEIELIKWIINFRSWVNAHRYFVKALNGWLALCLDYKPEETANGVPPYSPGSMGAPLIFVVCNRWSQAVDEISEKDVVNAMQALVSSVNHLWEQQNNLEQSEQMIAIREREKWIKNLERKAVEINKEADELNRKLTLVPSRQNFQRRTTIQTYEAHCIEASNIQINLKLVFQALENFAANSLQAFQEVLRHAREARLPREREGR